MSFDSLKSTLKNKSWSTLLNPEFEKLYFKDIEYLINQNYNTKICYPPYNDIFNAFNLCDYQNLKVVILGQDPYHQPLQANGLSFSVNEGVKHPPSLINIFKELKDDIGINIPLSGSLDKWAKQGILLLNSILTVEKNKPSSHKSVGWLTFTKSVISKINNENEYIIFVLWGGYAQKFKTLIDNNKHDIILAGHPSPLSANRGYWFGNKTFSKINALLKQRFLDEIDWTVD